MIDRDYRFTVSGRQTATKFIERYYGVYMEALNDLVAFCNNPEAYNMLPEDPLIAKIEERVPNSDGCYYVLARMEWVFHDKEKTTS